MLRKFYIALLLCFSTLTCAIAQAQMLSDSLQEAIKLAREESLIAGKKVWPNYENAPFGMLLTLADKELLLCHSGSVEGFTPTEEIIGCSAQYRSNVFPQHLLAAMPAIESTSTIVMGTPESTGLANDDWIRTIFHEHFHQYQSTFDNYYTRVNQLNLSNGDTTGMWMLNYPFPYQSEPFNTQFNHAKLALYQAITAPEETLNEAVKAYLKQRKRLQQTVTTEQWRYLDFQLWAEGIARWTEIAIAERSEVASVRSNGQHYNAEVKASLRSLSPAKAGRPFVYTFGAAEGMLLERCAKRWKEQYPKSLQLSTLIENIVAERCQ